MKICHINLAKGFRGGESQTLALIRALGDRVEQAVIVRRGGEFEQRLADIPGLSLTAVRSFAPAVVSASRHADILHVHEGQSVKAAFLANRFFRQTYLITRRVPRTPHANALTRACYNRSACVAAVSQAVAQVMKTYDAALRVEVVPDCVPPDIDKSADVAAAPRVPSGMRVVGHVAALVDRHKGQAILIDAARQMAASHPNVEFWLIGEGEDEARLRKRASGLGNVRFLGWVDNIADYYRAIDVFAFPSRGEALGSAILEAMHFGLPVVAARVGGIPEVVNDGETGWLFEPGNAGDLALKLGAVLDDDALRQAMSNAARTRAASFSADNMAQQYLRLYQDIS